MPGRICEQEPMVGKILNASIYYDLEKIIEKTHRDPIAVIHSFMKRRPLPKIRTKEDLYDLLDHYEEDEQLQAELREQQFQSID